MKSSGDTSCSLAWYGILILAFSVMLGASIYSQGYGTGGGGVFDMIIGIGIGLIGCIVSLIFGVISISKPNHSKIPSILAIFVPIILVMLCFTGVIRL